MYFYLFTLRFIVKQHSVWEAKEDFTVNFNIWHEGILILQIIDYW